MEIEQFFVNRQPPFLLAYPQKVLLASSTAQEKIAAMKDVVESIVKYSVAVLMSDKHYKAPVGSIVSTESKQDWSLTTWLNWLESLVTDLQSQGKPVFMPELLRIFEKKQKSEYLSVMHKFEEKIRTGELEYGYVREEGWYMILVGRLSRT